MPNFIKINYCRLCYSKDLIKIIDFKKIAIGNNLENRKSLAIKAKKFKLLLNKCNQCHHFQLGHVVDHHILYKKNYTYLSGVGQSFIKHFNDYVKWSNKKIPYLKKCKVLDIGSNDGTCLKAFKKIGCFVLGVDPAKKPAKIANQNKIVTINSFFDNKTANYILKKYGSFDFITSHNVLAHVNDLRKIFKNIYDVLIIDGFFCFEVGYLHEVLTKNYFDTIYHEHLDYHHASSLSVFLNKIGFSLINISTNFIQGGSIRILCQKSKKITNTKQVINFIKKEKKSIIYNNNYLKNWETAIFKKMKKFHSLVEKEYKNNKIIIGYGSPTKIVLLLNIANLNSNKISAILEDNKLKQNKFLPTTGIPIFNTNIISTIKPDVIIIFAWNFKDDIIKILRKKYKKSIDIIMPLPNPKKIKI